MMRISISSAASGSTTSPMCGCTPRRASGRATDSIATSVCCCSRSRRVRIRHSLVPDAPRRTAPSAAPRPLVAVEKRPLAVYARLTGGLA